MGHLKQSLNVNAATLYDVSSHKNTLDGPQTNTCYNSFFIGTSKFLPRLGVLSFDPFFLQFSPDPYHPKYMLKMLLLSKLLFGRFPRSNSELLVVFGEFHTKFVLFIKLSPYKRRVYRVNNN